MLRCDVAVVGAGPAGMCAALAAAEMGAEVVMVDELARAGGQYFKRTSEAFAVESGRLTREHERGERLRQQIRNANVRLLTHTIVWGVFDERTVMLFDGAKSFALSTGALVIATGAHDRPVAFPGWTLPGVMTAGAAQTLSKTQWVSPGKRILLSGAGPFMLPVAQNLIRAGAEVVAILDASSRMTWARLGVSACGQPNRFSEAADYWRTIRQAGVPVKPGYKLVAADGNGKVESATYARVDDDWCALKGTESNIDVDAIAIGYGFLPSLEIAVSCGSKLRWDPDGRSWFVDVNPDMATSREGIFAAGEIVGIGGSTPAMQEGRIAGTSAARYAGLKTPEISHRQRGTFRRAQRFAGSINHLFRPRDGLWEGMTDEVTVCRCEEVTAGEIRHCIRSGCRSLKEIKDWTRAGMGLCQGRICRSLITSMFAQETGSDPGDLRFPSIRPPIKPVPMSALADSEVPDTSDLLAGAEQ